MALHIQRFLLLSSHDLKIKCSQFDLSFTVFLDKSASWKLELHSWQHELSIPALKGNSCILCAPTNSGKTYVVLAIATAHLAENRVPIDSSQSEVLGKGSL